MSSKLNEYAYESGQIASAPVGGTSSVVLATNPQRRYALLSNTGGADCYLAIGGPAEAGKGIYLKAGGAYEILGNKLTHAAIAAITASGTTTLALQEGY